MRYTDKYRTAITQIPCPRTGCKATVGIVCNTSTGFHLERRQEALDRGIWDPREAIRGTYGPMDGSPILAYRLDDLQFRN